MKIFVLDNYDSFTYNLVQYLAELGANVSVERNDQTTIGKIKKRKPSGIVLSPGPGRPENAGIMNDLVAELGGMIPLLGVCLGHQSIAQVHGAEITYAPTLMHGKTSEVTHNGSDLYKNLESPFTATRYHSLVVDPKTVPTSLVVTSRSDDGVIMGLSHQTYPIHGVQFHPESILTQVGKQLLKNFLETL